MEGVTVMGEEANGLPPPIADAGDGNADRVLLNEEAPNVDGWLVPNADFGAEGVVPKAL